MQFICTSLQTNKHASTLYSIFTGQTLLFLTLNQQCQSTENNMTLICWFVNTASRLKDVNITQQIVAIYPQPSAGCEHKPTVNCKNCSYIIHAHIIMHNSGTQHSTKQFWQSFLLSSRQSSLLRCCTLDDRNWMNKNWIVYRWRVLPVITACWQNTTCQVVTQS